MADSYSLEARTSASPTTALAGPSRPYRSPTPPSVTSYGPPSYYKHSDIDGVKQELHDALGENGLPYWRALRGYLLGQIGRGELEAMIRAWLDGRKVQLHNRLLQCILNAASLPQSVSTRKRKRGDEAFDSDDTVIDQQARIQQWIMGIGGKERARIRLAMIRLEEADEEGSTQRVGLRGRNAFSNTMPSLSVPIRHLASAHQLASRLQQMAKLYDLNVPPDALSDIGEVLAVGQDAQLADIFHSLVHMTGKDRLGSDTLHVPRGIKREQSPDDSMSFDDSYRLNGSAEGDSGAYVKQEPADDPVSHGEGELPKPDLETMQYLFNLTPGLASHTSAAVHKLVSSHSTGEARLAETIKQEDKPVIPLTLNGIAGAGESAATRRSRDADYADSGRRRVDVDDRTQKLVEAGLLKIDKAGRPSEPDGEGRKERKHNLHWKYEDPALILKDVLG